MAKRINDIVDVKARDGIPDAPGLGKVKNESAWGESMATSRYGGGTRTYPAPKEQSLPQELGSTPYGTPLLAGRGDGSGVACLPSNGTLPMDWGPVC